jgi:hypothetical protein
MFFAVFSESLEALVSAQVIRLSISSVNQEEEKEEEEGKNSKSKTPCQVPSFGSFVYSILLFK